MTQARGALPTPTVLDYERTLILAIELSNTSWVLAAQIPGLSSETKCNTPADLIIGTADQDLRECCHAMLFAFVG